MVTNNAPSHLAYGNMKRETLHSASLSMTLGLNTPTLLMHTTYSVSCDISMPGYIERALTCFQHPAPTQKQHSPHEHDVPQYGAKTQYTEDPDNSPILDAADTKRIQEVLGTLLYCARTIDSTMLPAIGTIAMQQAKPTRKTMQAITQLLNYCATHPNAIVASDMVLHVESDASYMSAPKVRSRSACFFFFSDKLKIEDTAPSPEDPPDAQWRHQHCQQYHVGSGYQ